MPSHRWRLVRPAPLLLLLGSAPALASRHIVPAAAVGTCLGSNGSGAPDLLECEPPPANSRLVWQPPATSAGGGALELSGSPGAARLCLNGANGTNGTTLVTLVACGVGADLWVWDEKIRLIHVASGHCLTRKPAGAVAMLVVETCGSDPAGQAGASDSDALLSQQWLSFPTGTSQKLAEVRPPLRVKGRYIIDSRGVRVKLAGTNWAGAHQEQRVNGGLEFAPVREIAKTIRRMGFNHVRMNYAVEMLWDTVPVNPSLVAANPQLVGRTPLEIFDACIDALTAEGLLVVINSHNSDYRWCCSLVDDQALWYNSRWPESKWLESLTLMARRYRANALVVGYDLRNEPRPDMPQGSSDPTLLWWDPEADWPPCQSVSVQVGPDLSVDLGSFSSRGICLKEHTANLRKAMEQGSLAVWHGNPEALVFVEGVGAGELVKVLEQPMRFKQSCLHSRVAYSIHDYPWAERWFDLSTLLKDGAGSFGEFFGRAIQLYQPAANTFNGSIKLKRDAWGYLLERDLAPVWLGEVGWYTADGGWWDAFAAYTRDQDIDWAWWKLVGSKYPPGVRFAEGGNYFDPAQRLSAPGGVTATYEADHFGLLSIDPRVAQRPIRLQRLLSLVPARLGPGIAGAPPTQVPGACDFDPGLQPVVGTGPLPRGFAAYGSVQRGPSCSASRRLANASLAALPQLVEDSDRALIARLREDRGASCQDQEPVQLALGTAREERYRDLAQIAGPDNPIAAALRQLDPQAAQGALLDHLSSLERVTVIFYWLGGGIIAFGILVWALYCKQRGRCHEAKHCLRWMCTPVLGPVAPPGPYSQHDHSHRPHYRSAQWLEKLEWHWRRIIVVEFVALAVIFYFCAVNLMGRNLLVYGSSSVWCSLASFVDEALSGASGSFIGFVPALEKVHAFASDLHDPSGIRQELKALLTQLEALKAAWTEADNRYVALRAALQQPLAECALGTEVQGLLGFAEFEYTRSFEYILVTKGIDVLRDLGGKASDALEQDLTKVLDPLQNVKTIVLGSFEGFYGSSTRQAVMNGMNVGLEVALGLACLVLPVLIFGLVAAMRLLCDTYLGKRSCFEPYSAEPPHFACAVWACALIYGMVSLAIAILVGIASAEGADFCTVANSALDTGLDAYMPALGIPADPFVRGATSSVFDTCFTRSGNGQLLDVIQFDGCSGGSSIATSDSLRGRLQSVNSSFSNYLSQAEQHFTASVSRGPNMLNLFAKLEELANSSGDVGFVDGVASCSAASNATMYDCPALPPTVMPGLCEGEELANRISAIGPRLKASLEKLEATATDTTSGILQEVSRTLSDRIIRRVLELIGKLDCSSLGAYVQDLVDSTCVGVVLGLRQISFANYGLAGSSWFLALTTYLFWRQFARAYDLLHREHNESPEEGGGGGAEAPASGGAGGEAGGSATETGAAEAGRSAEEPRGLPPGSFSL